MTRAFLLPIAALALLAACTAPSGTPSQTAADTPPAATAAEPGPPMKVAGPAVRCVPIRQIRETRVLSDGIIDFHMAGGQVLRNRLPHGGCPQLGFERSFTYSTSLSQLCSVDIITVIRNAGGISRGASCGLGEFLPIVPADK
jgi:hypothetical protein